MLYGAVREDGESGVGIEQYPLAIGDDIHAGPFLRRHGEPHTVIGILLEFLVSQTPRPVLVQGPE